MDDWEKIKEYELNDEKKSMLTNIYKGMKGSVQARLDLTLVLGNIIKTLHGINPKVKKWVVEQHM
jgi:hypothetical protein